MYRLLLLSSLAVFGSVIGLSDVNKKCIADNNEAWSNDNLVGTWYMIWKFMLSSMVSTTECPYHNYTRPSAEIIQEYKNKYNDPNLPYNMDDNPLLVNNGWAVDGMVFGHNVAKFFVLSPSSVKTLNWDGYEVNTYHQLTPKYIMYSQCAMRGNIRWLMTNDRHAPVAEIEELIKNTPELNRLDGQRFCATY